MCEPHTQIWHHTFYKELKIEPENSPVLLTVPSNSSEMHAEKMAEIMFEVFKVPAIHLAHECTLCSYSAVHTTALVINSGYDVTRITPVYDRCPIPDAGTQLDLAGRDVTNYLGKLLEPQYPQYATDYDLVNEVKKELCYVARSSDSRAYPNSYKCPDDKYIAIDKERAQCPEILFNPSLIGMSSPGIHELCYQSVMRCREDIHKELFENIVLVGGNTFYSGIAERLQEEIAALVPPRIKVNIIAPPERKSYVWIGGSILASLAMFQDIWIGRQQYDELGPAAVHVKC